MTYEFEGKTEKDAIDKAVSELDLNVDQFDVEILEFQRGGFFKKGYVKIRVHVDDEFLGVESQKARESKQATSSKKIERAFTQTGEPVSDEDISMVKNFLEKILELMGHKTDTDVIKSEPRELSLKISGERPPHIIGKGGKTLDALQLMTNIYLSKIGYPHVRASVDCENYRRQKEESIIRIAYETADKVTSTKHSVLLDPMNPYERRIVHTTLSDVNYVETKSEGSGLYKQVRVLYKR